MDREKYLARKRRYHERHIEQDRERNRLWRERNHDYVARKNREYRNAHPGEDIERSKKWAENNPSRYAASKRAEACNRRAKAAGAPGHISTAAVYDLWQRQPSCIRCGTGRGVDHIIDFRHGGRNEPDNIQNLCRTCNELKAAKITMERAREIRAAYAAGERSGSLAERYAITRGNVWLIVTNQTWKDPA